MRRIREVLRQRWECGFSERAVAASGGMARSTVGKYVRRAREAGLSWPLPPDLTDEELEPRLLPTACPEAGGPRFVAEWVKPQEADIEDPHREQEAIACFNSHLS